MTQAQVQSKPLPVVPLPVPLFWPVAMAAGMEKAKADIAVKNLEFLNEELKIHGSLKPIFATPNVVRLDLRTMLLREYGRPGGMPTLVNAPFAGHRSMIADFARARASSRRSSTRGSAMSR